MNRFKAVVYSFVLATLITALTFAPFSFAATTGVQIEFLLSQVRNATGSLAGGKVYFYSAGTTTNKAVYLDINKVSQAANPYTLDANGTALLYGDGTYRVVIKTAAGVTVYDRDNLKFEDLATDIINSEYTLNLKPKSITGNNTGNIQGYDNLTINRNLTGGGIGNITGFDNATFSGTIRGLDFITNGPWVDVRWFMDGLSGRNALATWVADNTTNVTAAVKAAIDNVTTTGGTVYFPKGTYKVTDGFYVRGNVNLVGDGSASRIVQTGTSFATTTVLFYYQSPTTTSFGATGTLSAGGNTLTLSSTTGLDTGTEVFLQLGAAKYDATQPYVSMFNRITGVSGLTVTFDIPFPENINGTSHNVLLLTRIVQGVTISNLSLEADPSAQPDQAMYIERCRNVTVKNVVMNHTGAIVNAQSENVSLENIYSKRARKYGSYATSGRFINGWGYRNFLIKNAFAMDIDGTGIYLEAEGRGASIENYVYQVGPDRLTSGYGLWVGGDCKGTTLKNGHFNAPYTNFFGVYAIENSVIRTEDVYLYNTTMSEGFLKNHFGLLGWDNGAGTMTYYDKIKQYTIKIAMDNSLNTTKILPSGIYKQIRAWTDNATVITNLQFKYEGNIAADLATSLQTDNTVDLSTLALTSLGPDASYPFNNYTGHTLSVVTDNAASGKSLVVNIEYYAITNDANHGMIQDTY